MEFKLINLCNNLSGSTRNLQKFKLKMIIKRRIFNGTGFFIEFGNFLTVITEKILKWTQDFVIIIYFVFLSVFQSYSITLKLLL